MKDLIWDIAKSGEETLENTELQSIEEPKELFIARGVSLEAKDSTYKINKFVDNKIALDVQEKGAIKIMKGLYGTYQNVNNKSQKVNGDMTKVKWVPEVASCPAARKLLLNLCLLYTSPSPRDRG